MSALKPNDISAEMEHSAKANPKFYSLYNQLKEKYSIEVVEEEFDKDGNVLKNWGCIIKDNSIVIKAPNKSRDLNAFAHEVLHVKLDDEMFSTIDKVYSWLKKLPDPIPELFNDVYTVAHINNGLAHRKMIGEFVELGFPEESFVQDHDSCPVMDEYMKDIVKNLHSKKFPNDSVYLYIGQYISLAYCRNKKFDKENTSCINELKELDESLYAICYEFLSEWETLPVDENLPLIIKFAYNVRDWHNAVHDTKAV